MTSILSKFSGTKEIHLPDDKDQSVWKRFLIMDQDVISKPEKYFI